jgi:hypothetical protein
MISPLLLLPTLIKCAAIETATDGITPDFGVAPSSTANSTGFNVFMIGDWGSPGQVSLIKPMNDLALKSRPEYL